MKLRGTGLLGVAAIALAAAWACGGGASPGAPSGPGTPTPTPTAAPTPTPQATPWVPPAFLRCSLGYGNAFAQCALQDGRLLDTVDQAINRLVAARPGLFDTSQISGPGGFRVLDEEQYFQGVVDELRAAGLCAELEGELVHAKSSNDFSERYDLLLSSGHIRRGTSSCRATCIPASFPLNPAQVIDQVRVAFHSMRCPDDRPLPGQGEGLLPLGCRGDVTATPKDINDDDVSAEVHGPEIAWQLRSGGEVVGVDDIPDQPFNKRLTALALGEFAICATVQTVEGCLNGRVVP